MSLQRLIYISRPQNVKKAGITAIQNSSKKNNKTRHISGILAFNSNFFIQVLEGERRIICKTFDNIYNDQRHTDIELVSCSDIYHRSYSEWSMKFVPLSKVSKTLLLKYTVNGILDPYDLSAKSISQFCEELRDLRV